MASLKLTIPLVLFTVIIWTALFCDAETNAGGDVGKVLRKWGTNQIEFDYFQFSLVWPPAYCRSDCNCNSNACCPGSSRPNFFVINGLWPDYDGGTWPSCCGGERFNVTKILPFLGALDKYWPSLTCDSPDTCNGDEGLIWQYEWETHGTCASSVLGGDQYNYFLTALDLYHEYNVTEILRKAGYVASYTAKYPLKGIISAIENAFSATPQLQCRSGGVRAVNLCFDKEFKPRDCVSRRTCPRNVSLPLFLNPVEPREVKLKLPSSI